MGNQGSAAMKKFSTAAEATQRFGGTDATACRCQQAFSIHQSNIATHAHSHRAGGDEGEIPRPSELKLRITDCIDEQRGAGR
jgi:hypothetical protein